MNFESLLDIQERGSKARILGQPLADNPFADCAGQCPRDEDAAELFHAWQFGWAMEDTVRHIDAGIYGNLRVEAALAGLRAPRS
ncbi:hypothetical protein [Rhizobium sp. SSA_523]|uniref:hypothetical protein n=1 Tax=Rhizobium sp. SSA_523 TaxID=2952477 RepID=UPI0020914670|nr:hypothetical protein [Rhizobium sp. SSA_523]MCO5730219.1 hypothetical protein [Rhizobium sp. SSA_523]WKC25278.1 hypothetical protein QTJ18_14960 [Rhizobium sp. SSA_523]